VTFGGALGLGLRATLRQAWLVPVGAGVAVARRVALWPAWALLGAAVAEAALAMLARRPLDPGAPIAGALAALSAPRVVGVVVGLWLAGTLLGAALRVAWLAGALPSLAAAMAGPSPGPRFATGVAYGFPRVLAAAALALVADLAGGAFAWALALGALRISIHAVLGGGSALFAAAVALALVLAILVPLATGTVADAAVARAAIREEGPAAAFAGGVRRFLAAPGTFLLAAMAFAVAGAIAPATVEATGAAATGFARGAAPLLLAGPNAMIALVALLVGAALDLWWLATVSALACAPRDGGRE
jgi:hypothetical protein